MSRLRDAAVTVYRTDLQGDILCTSDGTSVHFSVEKNADANTLVPPSVSTAPAITDGVPNQNAKPSAAENYVGNKNSMKFHYDWCSSVDKMKESNKFCYTGTREEMINMGYDPCGNCHP